MRNPNTFIIGAPKCGTTALASYLAGHPNVFMSSPKEPHHFVHEDMPEKSNYASQTKYLEIFEMANENHLIIAEASVWYLYSADAIKKIATFDKKAKLILMLRRPDEMVYSMHSQGVVTLQENIVDFEQAWKLSVSNTKRLSYSALCKEPRLLQYNQIAKYGKQLANVKSHFPDSQIHIVFYDDFKLNTSSEYKRVLQFLNLPLEERKTFPTVNPNTQLRNPKAGAILKKTSPTFMAGINRFKKILGIKKLGIKQKLRKLNEKKTERLPLSADLKQEIILVYKDDIELLAEITNRDLTHWLS